MHGNVTALTPPPEPIIKHRTITLTNRAPIRIQEDDWPIIAKGQCGYTVDGAPYCWEIAIYLRREKTWDGLNAREIIHARYKQWDDDYEPEYSADKKNQIVRVGRMLTWVEAAEGLWGHILAVGEQLRVRIFDEDKRKYVTAAIDHLFENLDAHDEKVWRKNKPAD